ncbi:nuclear transport factor 2 family protein [uncultured Hyphomonas sp.]|uniref:nuclear transport factor 2 family protein n=1 Tax=uncultured Hyphomonas sp. TaxID=225298 RepID=UPI002AAB4BAD|nr:nuclear transport factor 2 family protein [uncultured Hyphomonas sp.]
MNDPNGTATKFFDAIERGSFSEVENIYSDDVAIWHSNDDQTQGKAENLAVLKGASGLVGFRYDILHRSVEGDVVAQHHRLHLTRRDNGSETAIQAAIFLTVSGNRITRIDEFIEQSADERINKLLAD